MCKHPFIFILLCLFISGKPQAANNALPVDIFGVTKFYPTKPGTFEWNSLHWKNGIPRTIKYSRDPYDPVNWTEDHSSSTDGFAIDGNGVMKMSGGGPRFHINSLTPSVCTQFFVNVEFTAYYRRIGTNGANYGGMVVGLRSGPLGHASSGGNDCDATTYYARFRNDGKWDFEKELKHPTSDYFSTNGFHTQPPLWGGKTLPENRWIGMKYLIYNIDNNTKVKLELYIDSTSQGITTAGGDWKKVGEVIDDGNWPAASGEISGCSYSDPETIITEGHGTVLMRTDGDGAEYKMVTIREITIPPSTPVLRSKQFHTQVKKDQPTSYNLLGRIQDFPVNALQKKYHIRKTIQK